MQPRDLRAGFASLLYIFLLGVAHAGAYALLTPVWQAPDEPGHFEAACLLSQLTRPLRADDLSIPLQQSIIASLAANDFWGQVREPSPTPLPASFSADPFLARSGRQVGDEPPLYYLFPALLCRSPLPLEGQLRLIRLYGAILFGLTGAVAGWELERWRVWSLRRVPPVMMLLPMPAFIAGSVNNDGLAMLTATAVFVAVMRVQRLGWSWRRGLGVLACLALALAFFLWLSTTDQRELVAGFVALHMPYSWGLTLTLALRYLPILAGLFQQVVEAQQARGLDLARRGFMARLRAYRPVLVALVIGALRHSERLGWALETRALGAPGVVRTTYRPLRLKPVDRLCLAVLAVVLVAGVVLRTL